MCMPVVQVCGGRFYISRACVKVRRQPVMAVLAYYLVWDRAFLFFTSAYAIQLAHKFLGDSPVSGARSLP